MALFSLDFYHDSITRTSTAKFEINYLKRDELPVLIYDVVQQLAQPDETILDQFGVDVLDIGRTFNDCKSDWRAITMANGGSAYYPKWFNPTQMPDGSYQTCDDKKRVLSRMPVGATFLTRLISHS